jgi:hypothetical protein
MDIIDINVSKTVDSIDITVTPNLTTVNVNSITGVGNSASDAETQAGVIDTKYVSPLKLKNWWIYIKTLANTISGYWSFTNGLFADFIQFNLSTVAANAIGRLKWNDTDGTLDLGLKGGNVTLQIGQEQVTRVVNKSGVNLLESEYKVVYISGAQGGRLKCALALANNDALSNATLGLVTENISNNLEGFVTSNGLVRNVNTSGSLQGETWVDGDVLYLSGTVAGKITNIKPIAPNHLVMVGYVVNANPSVGSIYVKVQIGFGLNELHNVLVPAPLNDQVLTYETSSALWKPKDKRTYKVYTALLTQSGTSAPVATVLENTLGGTVSWSYVSIGNYKATLTGAFTINKTSFFLTNGASTALSIFRSSSDQIIIYAPTDGNINSATLEIRVYN